MTALHVDRAIEALARQQHHAFNHQQAEAAGATDDIVAARLRSGRWRRLDPAVYALGAVGPTWQQRFMAATLAETDAVISHRAAAALHGLPTFGPCRAEIRVPPRANARSRLAQVHRTAVIESTVVDHIPVTTAAVTLFDIAATIGPSRLRRTMEGSLERGVVTPSELIAHLEALDGTRRKGLPLMRALLDQLSDHTDQPATTLEQLLHGVLTDPRVPPWQAEAPVPWDAAGRSRVDVFIPEWRLIIEADSRRWHTRADDFVRDRARDNAAVAHGYRVLRFTWDDLTLRPAEVLATILRVGALAA